MGCTATQSAASVQSPCASPAWAWALYGHAHGLQGACGGERGSGSGARGTNLTGREPRLRAGDERGRTELHRHEPGLDHLVERAGLRPAVAGGQHCAASHAVGKHATVSHGAQRTAPSGSGANRAGNGNVAQAEASARATLQGAQRCR